MASWLEGTKFERIDTYHLIARSAFGDRYLWGEKTGASLKITTLLSRYTEHKGLRSFFLSRNVESND